MTKDTRIIGHHFSYPWDTKRSEGERYADSVGRTWEYIHPGASALIGLGCEVCDKTVSLYDDDGIYSSDMPEGWINLGAFRFVCSEECKQAYLRQKEEAERQRIADLTKAIVIPKGEKVFLMGDVLDWSVAQGNLTLLVRNYESWEI